MSRLIPEEMQWVVLKSVTGSLRTFQTSEGQMTFVIILRLYFLFHLETTCCVMTSSLKRLRNCVCVFVFKQLLIFNI